MIIFDKIELLNFRSFYGSHTIPFPKNGIVAIQGNNKDSLGESGAGKSTLFLAISYALDICPFSAKELVSWNGTDMQIKLHINKNNEKFIINKGDVNSIEINRKTTITGAKAIEEKLEEIFGLNKEQRYSALYKEQGVYGYFLTKTNNDKKEFLSTILNFNKFDQEIDNTQDIINNQEKQLNIENSQLNLYDQQLFEIQNKQKLIKEPEYFEYLEDVNEELLSITESLIHTISSEKDLVKNKINEFESQKRNKITLLWEELNETEKFENIVKIKDELKILKSQSPPLLASDTYYKQKLNEIKYIENTVKTNLLKKQQLEAELIKFNENLSKLLINKCYVCDQAWLSSNEIDLVNQKISTLNKEVALIDDQLANVDVNKMKQDLDEQRHLDINLFNNQQNEIKNKETELSNVLKNTQFEIREKIKNEENVANPFNEELKELNAKQLISIQTKNDLIKKINLNKKNKNDYIIKKTAYETECKILNENIVSIKQKIHDLSSKIENIKDSLSYNKERQNFLKGFMNYIFEDVLNEIASQTNQILSQIANVSHVTIRFSPEKSTSKGKIKQEISTIVLINGQERPLKSGLSGGMLAAVQLATDLSLRKVINRRVGVDWGLLMVDEQLGGLDLISKQACFSILKQFANESLVMIIDHDMDINEASVERLNIVYENGKSKCIY